MDKRRCVERSSRKHEAGRLKDSPEGRVVVLEELGLDVGEEKV